MSDSNGRSISTLRPIVDWEYFYLDRLGRRIRELRAERGLMQRSLAIQAQLHPASLRRIELGNRRTRESTLRRIVAALSVPIEEQNALVRELAALAGPALAEESEFRAGGGARQ